VWWFAVSGGLAAACLAAVLLWWWGSRGRDIERADRSPPPLAPATEVEDPGPTLLAYERALARSPEELDALLDKHGTAGEEPDPGLALHDIFIRSDAALRPLLGDN
jgi:hypothetical protein